MNNKQTQKQAIAVLKYFKALNKRNTKVYFSNNIIKIVNDYDTQSEIIYNIEIPAGLYEISDILEVLKLDLFTYEVLSNNQLKLVFEKMSRTIYFSDNEFEIEQYLKNTLVYTNILKSILLKHDFNLTNYSQAINDSRAMLNATHIYNSNKSLIVESTDGHRANIVTYSNIEQPNFDFIISNKVTNILSKLSNEVNILECDNSILVFEVGNIKIISKKVDAKYVDMHRIVPTNNEIMIKINRLEMLEAIKKLGKPLSKLKSLYLRLQDNSLLLDNESSNIAISCIVEKNIYDTVINVALNQDYMLDLVKYATCEDLTLCMFDNQRSILVTHNSKDFSLYQISVVMPLRT